jgi:hypothetical protein
MKDQLFDHWLTQLSLPWGSGFSVSPGQTVHFTFTLGSNNNWTATLSGPGSATTTLNIPNNTMNRSVTCYYTLYMASDLLFNRAILAVEVCHCCSKEPFIDSRSS